MNIRRDAFSALMLLGLLATPVFAQEDDGSPTPGTLKWSFQTRGQVVSSPAIGEDGTVYVGSADRRLYAITSEFDDEGGTNRAIEKWSLKLSAPIMTSPVIDSNGTIYVGCTDGRLFAISDNGTNGQFKWPRPFSAGSAVTTVAIDDEGTIFVGSRGNHLFAIDPSDGGRKWFITAPDDVGTPVISSSGDIYFKTGRRLIGLNASGSEVFSFLADRVIGSLPTFGEDGSIYFGAVDNRVYAVRSSGSSTNATRWRFDTGADVLSAPAIGASGDIYIGSDARRVYCLTTNGVVRWRFLTKGPVRSPLAIGADGTIYAGAEDRRLYAITADGSNKWTFTGARGAIRSSPAIDADGTVYFGSLDKRVYAVYDNVSSETSAWPQFRRDAAHTARATGGEPFITQQPPSEVSATNGQRIELTVRVSSGAGVTYQWLFNGAEIDSDENPTATNATLVIASASAADQGVYEVVVASRFGETQSEPTELFIRSLVPLIASDLTNRVVSAGSTVRLQVTAVGEEPLRFQWFFNAAAVPGETNNSLTISNAQAANAGSFHVLVSNTNGSTLSRTSVVTVLSISLTLAPHAIAAGNRFSGAILTNAQLFMWGLNSFGQLGNGDGDTGNTNGSRNIPSTMNSSTNWIAVSAGGRGSSTALAGHALALRPDGSLWAWGLNNRGQLGIGSTANRTIAIMVGSSSSETNWIQAEAGSEHSIALKNDGTIWTWGANDFGQLGNGTTNSGTTVPQQVGVDSAWIEVRAGGVFTLARRGDGTIWGWGRNDSGQLGIGSTNHQSLPVQIGTSASWTAISAGASHSLGLQSDGSLWIWGRNFGLTSLQVANSTNIFRTPTRVGSASDWATIDAGFDHSLALTTDRRMFAWGANNIGQLGNGHTGPTTGSTNTENQSLPVQVGTDRNWDAIDAGTKHSLARATDGTIWAWGWNNNGQLGDGTGGNGTDANNRNVPVPLTFTNVIVTTNTSNNAPVITQQPASRSASITSTVGFSVTATGASPITYQWRFNSNSIPVSQNSSATNSALVLQNIQATNQGSYDVVVANSFGSVTSAVATLTITNVPTNSGPPVIALQPANKTSFASSSAEFKVVASGAPPLSYQWRFKGIEISSASNLTAITDTLTLVNLRTNDAGGYDVIVTNFLGAITSAVATLTVAQIVPPLAAAPATSEEEIVQATVRIAALTHLGDRVVLSIEAAADEAFVVEFTDSLETQDWKSLATGVGNGTTASVVDRAPNGASRFYRVRSP